MDAQKVESWAERVKKLVSSAGDEEARIETVPTKPLWRRVRKTGSELWLDTGDMEESSDLYCQEFSAFTTNNTLLQKEVKKGTYDELIARVAEALAGHLSEQHFILDTAFVLNAPHALRLAQRFNAMVSVELHTDLAHDADASVAYARRYHEIAPDNFYIKVPFTPSGLVAVRRLSNEGIPVNCTLGFSARQNYLIARVGRPEFVNVFLGRLNSFVADNDLGTGRMVGERAAIASHRTVSQLRAQEETPSRQIAASMREGNQVLALAGISVLTMPTSVVREFEEQDPPDESIVSRTGELPEVNSGMEVDGCQFGLQRLWDVPDNFKSAVDRLQKANIPALTGDQIREYFADVDFPDVMPDWSETDVEAARQQGKIPDYDYWKERLKRRKVGLDALMNLCGLHYFADAQQAMDERVRSLL